MLSALSSTRVAASTRAATLRSALACLATAAGASSALAQAPVTWPYAALTDNRVEVTNLNPEPCTGMVFDSSGRLYAVNPYASTVVSYSAITTAPDLEFRTGMNPVSVAVWEPGPTYADRKILVACNGTHGLFAHSPADGRITDFVRLDSEPLDLVVDPDNGFAYVSCQGDNTVVQVNLANMRIVGRFAITCGIRPGPLHLDRGNTSVASDNRVYVAAAITGNNSIPLGPNGAAAGSVLDLTGNPGGELPDHDVFRIDPVAGTIVPVIRGSGSLHFDLDRNPATGNVWVLSTLSRNNVPALDTEPKLQGIFAINQLVVVPGITSTSALQQAPAGIDLDVVGPPSAPYVATRSVNQARTVAFVPSGPALGAAFVASIQSDVIAVLDSSGNRIADLNLPAGSQCYDLEVWPLAPNVLVALCLGSMTIQVFDWTVSATPLASVPLGLDPTPDQIRRGRAVFNDGSRSAFGRFSCNSCHPRAMTDMLDWPLRGDPTDEKDIMRTQSLLSIADTFPHHWRGERDLEDFKKAFDGLLGASASKVPTTAEMQDVIVFIQSLQAPPNPVENPQRVLDESVGMQTAPTGFAVHAVTGQTTFNTVQNFNGNTCGDCHMQQTGSDAGHLAEVLGSLAPRSLPLEVAHLRQLQHISVDTTSVSLGGTPFLVNENGYGASHNGGLATVFNFINDIGVFDAIGDQGAADVFGFVQQLDQGISPASAWGVRFVQGSPASVATDIQRILIQGADNPRRWNDVVAFGRTSTPSGWVRTHWWYDPATQTFVSDVAGIGPISWTTMQGRTSTGLIENVFFGVPPENGRRIALDPDNDGATTDVELASGSDPMEPDTDGDGWVDGHELANGDSPTVSQATSSDATAPALVAHQLDFANSRLAKFHVRFDEDVKYTVTYSVSGGPLRTFTRDYFSSEDTFVLTHEEPSTPAFPPLFPSPTVLNFAVSIAYVDRNGNPGGPTSLTGFQPDFATFSNLPLFFVHVKDMQWTQQIRTGSTLDAKVQIRMDFNYFAPSFDPPGFEVSNQMVFCSVATKNMTTGKWEKSTTFTTPLATTFDVADLAGTSASAYAVDPGPPWVCSPHTDATGATTIAFQVPGLVPGQEVKVTVMGVVSEVPPPTGFTAPVYGALSLLQLTPLLLEDTMETTIVF